jgi:trehalose utilization protein
VTFPESEVYLNHKFTDGTEKTILLGLKFYDYRNDQLFMQDRAGWYKKSGKGDIFYFMPGHSSRDFQNTVLSQMILNAVYFSIQ